MKVFIACLGTETNTFSPLPTGLETFRETMLYRGDATRHPPALFSAPLHVWRRLTEERQGRVVESLAAFAQPAGPTVRKVYEGFRDEILDDLKRALPVDMVLLNMHGAMVADGYEDCEGDLLARVRALVGPGVPVGAELDLHSHLTERMVANATALVLFKEYPHVDPAERAEELFRICLDAAEGRTKPVMSLYECRMIGTWRTPLEPVKGFVEEMKGLEGRDGVLSVSFCHGFPWGDVPEVGARMLVVTDDRPAHGAALAERLGRRIWDMRHETELPMLAVEEALDLAAAAPFGPVVVADRSDNAGGGAPGDSTFFLRAMLQRGLSDAVSGLYWDPVAVRFCQEAGEGGVLDLRLGGKCGPASGDPVDLRVEVRRIVEDARQSFGASVNRMGTAVWARAGGIDLVLNSVRTQVFHPDAFTQLGLELADKRLIVVKSTQHFYAGFAPLAAQVLWATAPGALVPDYAAIPFARRDPRFHPKVADPWQA